MFASVGCDDMLPRAAPKPSDMTESVVAPTVPEVSLLQESLKQPPTNAMPIKPAIKSYSEFKKAVLPRVTFTSPGLDPPAVSANKDLNFNKCDLNPLRPAISATTLSSANSNNNMIDIITSVKPNLTPPSNNTFYRRSLESAITYPSQHELNLINSNFALQQLHEQQRRSIERIMQNTTQAIKPKNDILTICAGTQTDASSTTTTTNETLTEALKNLASKDAVAELTLKVEAMQRNQERLIQICELLLLNSQPKPSVTNGAIIDVQFENDKYAIVQNTKQKQLQDALQYQSPVTKPVAQSTAYHANSPLQNGVNSRFPHQQNANPLNDLEKRSSDRSLVMNELAMKYLTNEKITEMMKEVNLGSTTPELQQTPLRNIENIDKGICDLSNASYRYLKKYRLLPEENNEYNAGTSPVVNGQHDLTKSPVILKQKQQNFSPLARSQPQQYSPYQGPCSPMYGSGKTDHIDLDNIRKQPKFL
ncbi:uncharacterized protein LOC119680947 isoform X2 [Teleopsis dalmanni]|uniref:uncharacterized protein LOC119680947 isoform X2 n=1 Tax=Teleopsis dalmanni TaxID=139649 RepID=UPI0018CC7FA0|nr:uncharacterized protein LOC119680947 isoform X2 [Teleopsis dalmanni]